MSLMSSLFTGVTGLQTSQNGLNTTAHNLSNTNTKGYTRQQVLLVDRQYQTLRKNVNAVGYEQVGLGTLYSKCRQVRDYFLDKSYRQENGKMEYYDTLSKGVEDIENIFDELDGTTFADTLDNFWVSVQELSKDPTSSVTQSVFVQRASELLTHAKNIYESLNDYQHNLNETVVDSVNRINAIGDQILTLNKQIMKIESGGLESANDLRDARNLLLDELSTYGKISYNEDVKGVVNVSFESVPLVNSDFINHIGIEMNKEDFAIPYWEFQSKYHFDENGKKIIDNIDDALVINNTSFDTGKLRSLVLARGDHSATYKDMEAFDNVASSLIMSIECEFDSMFHSLATQINDILENSESNYGRLNDENPKDYLLFTTLSDLDILSTQINQKFLKEPTLLGFKLASGEEDKETIDKIKQVFSDEKYSLNPGTYIKNNYIGNYNSLVEQIANIGDVYNAMVTTQKQTLTSVDNARKQILEVSNDEELTNLIQFQNAYNASSRYINAVNEMLEHLIEKLA